MDTPGYNIKAYNLPRIEYSDKTAGRRDSIWPFKLPAHKSQESNE